MKSLGEVNNNSLYLLNAYLLYQPLNSLHYHFPGIDSVISPFLHMRNMSLEVT